MRRNRQVRAAVGTNLWIAIQIFLLASVVLLGAFAARAAPVQTHYATPQQGVDAIVQAVRNDDLKTLQEALGPEGDTLLRSGDDVADAEGRARLLAAYDESAKLVNDSETRATLQIGKDGWPFPIPLVRDAKGWRFDTAAGREELINRRIGRNELSVVQASLAYADAQREYATFDRNGDGITEYAQRFMSTPKHKDGLYWPTAENEPPSPLGDLFAQAQAKGYHLGSTATPAPYLGYRYKILTSQGPHAAGGAYDYMAKGRMIGGFAMVAYPATYGVSGVMTFLVNHDGVVYQKDLGPKTASLAPAMTKFDPDKTWTAEPSG